MVGAVWDTALKKVPEQWVTSAAPALVFWAGALLVWSSTGWARLAEVTAWLAGQTTIVHLAFGLTALTVVAASVVVVRRATTPTLQLMEGYWPSWLAHLSARRRRKISARKADEEQIWAQRVDEWEKLKKESAQPSTQQPKQIAQQRTRRVERAAQLRAEMARLEHRLHHQPLHDSELLPTQIGNILRAAETRPIHRYGLDAVVVWPRLWLVMPENARHELTAARASLDAAVAATIWGAGFIAFTPWAIWAAPVGLLIAATAIRWWVPTRAEVFADLIDATYDLYRWEVYRQLCWPLPTTPEQEPVDGKVLTQYLYRGVDDPNLYFTHATESAKQPFSVSADHALPKTDMPAPEVHSGIHILSKLRRRGIRWFYHP